MILKATLCATALLAVLLAVASNAPADDLPNADKLNALEKKLVGAWIGESPCAGNLVFQADGTYHYCDFGPGGGAFEVGTWKVEWTALPPTLLLEPLPNEATEADDPKEVPFYLMKLHDKQLDFRWSEHADSIVHKHRRGTETDNVAVRIAILDHAVQRYLGNEKHGASVNLPPNLKSLVDTKVLSSAKSLLDPWGKEFEYDVAGKKTGNREVPDIWTVTPDKKIIDNWSNRK